MTRYPRSMNLVSGGRVHGFRAGRAVFAAFTRSLHITHALLLVITPVLPAQLPVQNAAPISPQIALSRTIFVSNGGVLRGLSYANACAPMVAGAFVAGCSWMQKNQQPTAGDNPPQAQPSVGHPQERVVVVVLGDHLDRSERLLVELKHADAGSEELLSALLDEAKSLQAANHICQQNAAKDNDPALTTVLDHLDRLLAELTNQPGGLSGATITRLQDEMNGEGLLFEVRVLRSRIPDKQAGKKSRSGRASI
jgi:hypothetical protein